MSNRPFKLELPKVPAEELSPLVKELLRLLEAQQSHIERLEDEIMKLKGGPGRPKIKPSKVDGATDPKSGEPKRLRCSRQNGLHRRLGMHPRVGPDWAGSPVELLRPPSVRAG